MLTEINIGVPTNNTHIRKEKFTTKITFEANGKEIAKEGDSEQVEWCL
jgi:hypothetical protein